MLRLGIAGIGVIATDYISLLATEQVMGVRITALCSRSKENMDRAVSAFALADVKMFVEYGEMLKSGLIDGVLICTPHPQHPAMVLQALEANLHVLVEKPVGLFADELAQSVQLLRQKPELVCGVLYNRRMSQVYQKAHAMVKAGAIGSLKRVTWVITNLYRTNAYYRSSPWRGSWQSEGGGLLMTQASHQLDLLQWICGMPTQVFAVCRTSERDIQVENEATLFLRFGENGVGQFIASAHECPGSNRLELCGSRGKITISDDSTMEYYRLESDEREFAEENRELFGTVPYDSERFTFGDSDNKVQQAATLQNFVDAVVDGGEISCSLGEGLNSLTVIQAAYLSSWTGVEISIPFDYELFKEKLKKRFVQ